MKRLFLIVAMLLYTGVVSAQGVEWDQPRSQVTNTPMFGDGDLPTFDHDKWHVVLFSSNGCAPCVAMKSFMQSDSQTAGLVSNAANSPFIYNEYVYGTPTGNMRIAEFNVTSFPTLVVVGPRGFKTDFEHGVVVYREVGFNPRGLSDRIRNAIRNFLGTQNPNPPPYNPTPVQPYPVTPNPVDTTLSQSPQAVFILDPQGIGENLKVKAGQIALSRLQAAHGVQLKMFAQPWSDDLGIKYGITRADTPCVVVEGGGRKIAFLSASALAALNNTDISVNPNDANPDIIPATVDPSNIGSMLSVGLASLLGGGGIGGLLTWFMSRAKAVTTVAVQSGVVVPGAVVPALGKVTGATDLIRGLLAQVVTDLVHKELGAATPVVTVTPVVPTVPSA